MKVLLSILIVSVGFVVSTLTTYDPEFEKLFQVTHIEKGDNTNFPQSGDKVTVHYTGTFPDTGRKFDSSKDRNQPFQFKLNMNHVIQCWDKVVERMSKGEKIKVICPSRLAYGERGAGGVIPPNADIAFEIEMINFTPIKTDM